MAIQGDSPIEAVLTLVTFAGCGLLVVCAIAAVAVPVFQWRQGRLRVADAVLAVVGFGVIAYALYKSFDPLPAEPTCTVLYAFWVLVLVAYLWLRVTNRAVLADIGAGATENSEG